MPGPLDGVKVIEIAQEIQGPYAGLFLADMGADVIKIEMRETGDLSRFMLVQLIAGPDARHADFSHYFLAMNRGKRSLTLDLKKPQAKPILDRLLDSADVLLTNYRPGVLDFPTKTTDEWMALLSAIDVLATPVQDYQDILNSEQALANGYISEMNHPQIGRVKVVGTPLSLSETPLSTTTPPPELGQHSEEVLIEAGFSWQDIAELHTKEVV